MSKIIVFTGVGSDYEHTLYFDDLVEVEEWVKSQNTQMTEGGCTGNWYEIYIRKDFSKYLERKDMWLNY